MLKAVEKKRVYEDIVKQIRDLIEKGRMKKGDQLPTERDLTETFKVSRASVREAIRTLESMRLVESRQGNGTYVIASSEESLVRPLAAALFHEKDDLIDIFYIRKIVEPHIAELAAEKATPEEIKELDAIMEEHEENLSGGLHAIRTDSAFHNYLARMAKNRVLERLLHAIVDLLTETRQEYLQNEEREHNSLHGHRDIHAAIKSGDGNAAKLAMRRHLTNIEKIVFRKKRERKRGSNSLS
jgi:GntR family transcriptional repressor for pyruvate dehydrogenase complex